MLTQRGSLNVQECPFSLSRFAGHHEEGAREVGKHGAAILQKGGRHCGGRWSDLDCKRSLFGLDAADRPGVSRRPCRIKHRYRRSILVAARYRDCQHTCWARRALGNRWRSPTIAGTRIIREVPDRTRRRDSDLWAFDLDRSSLGCLWSLRADIFPAVLRFVLDWCDSCHGFNACL
jgi:hypothetical protein